MPRKTSTIARKAELQRKHSDPKKLLGHRSELREEDRFICTVSPKLGATYNSFPRGWCGVPYQLELRAKVCITSENTKCS
jgi:hypothetical protein